MNLENYCSLQDPKLHAMLRYPNALGWVCAASTAPASGSRVGDQVIHVDEVCAEQRAVGLAHYKSYTDPQSWFCWYA
ncbi:MAG: hypothetical protein QOF35_1113 [Actinomycetota bacterium]|nr:hypothetical protein [Actinomycetota bacterium]